MFLPKLLLLCFIATTVYGKHLPTFHQVKGYQDDSCGIGLDFESGILGSLTFKNVEKEDVADISKNFLEHTIPEKVTKVDFDFGYYDSAKYLTAQFDKENHKIIIKPTEAFAQMEYDIESRSSDEPTSFDIDITAYCGEDYDDTTEFTFEQPIKDTNNNDPKFNRKEYVYRFGMPIKSGAVLTELLEVYAVDIDITNTKLEFTIDDNEDVEIVYVDSDYYETGKIHQAALKTKQDLPSSYKKEYTITATDQEGSRKGTAIVNITID